MILSIETSTRAFSVSLYKDGQIANIELVHEIAHSQNIVHTVNFLLKSINKSVEDLSAVYAGKGPGSFTGIRVGLSYANTLFQIMGIPLLGIPSLDLLAFEDGRWYNSVISFIKSRKNEVYAAAYRQGRRVSEYLALKKDDFSFFIKENKPSHLVSSKEDYGALGFNKGEIIAETIFTFPKARLTFSYAMECNLTPEGRYLKPLYVRDF